jgi:hypothetical protein
MHTNLYVKSVAIAYASHTATKGENRYFWRFFESNHLTKQKSGMGRSEGPQVERKRDGVLARILSSNAI